MPQLRPGNNRLLGIKGRSRRFDIGPAWKEGVVLLGGGFAADIMITLANPRTTPEAVGIYNRQLPYLDSPRGK